MGCKLAASIVGERGEEGATRAIVTRLGLAMFFSMNVMAFTMALWSQEWNGELSSAAQATFDLLRYACLFFSLPVLLLLGGPLVVNVIDELRSKRVTTDLLIAAGVVAAYGYSLVSVFRGSGHVYFEVGCMVLTTLTLGRYLEATGKLKTTQALRDLENLLPDRVRRREGTCEETISASEVRVGDTLRILPGERIPVDGVITSGSATIDEHVVSGESQPVVKDSSAHVFCGTLNLDGDLHIQAFAPPNESALRKLIDAVVAAASGEHRYRRLADRITCWFLPAIFVIASVVFCYYWLATNLPSGLMTSLAVVLIACPCALGLATPLALWSAIGCASRRGVLFQDGDCLSRLAEVDLVCFDKTGTLTDDEPKLRAIYLNESGNQAQAFDVAATISAATTHPLATAVSKAAAVNSSDENVLDPKTVPGRGITADHTIYGKVVLGSMRLLDEEGIDTCIQLNSCSADHRCGMASEVVRAQGEASLVALAYDGELQAMFFFDERLRAGAEEAVSKLKKNGIEIQVLTGDRQARADHLSSQLGITAIAELLPDQKLAKIESWKQAGRKVMMIGDGLNDGPALATAHVGVALGCGADLSRELADVCLLGNDLECIPGLLELGRDTVRTIRWNLLWAFGYNSIGVMLAAAGLLHPIFAAAAMVGSSVLVVSNSLRLAGAHGQPVAAETLPHTNATDEGGVATAARSTSNRITPAGSAL